MNVRVYWDDDSATHKVDSVYSCLSMDEEDKTGYITIIGA